MKSPLYLYIIDYLSQCKDIQAAWLIGSYGRNDQDAYSDIDILVCCDSGMIEKTYQSMQQTIKDVPDILIIKTLPQGRTINLADKQWNRVDISFITPADLAKYEKKNSRILFDHAHLTNDMPEEFEQNIASQAQEIRTVTEEFLRIAGLLPVVTGRHDPVIAVSGAQLLRDQLIKLLLLKNNGPKRGVLSFKKAVTADDYALLEMAPPLSPDFASVIAYHHYMMGIFLPRAQKLYGDYQLQWPDKLAESVLNRIQTVIAH